MPEFSESLIAPDGRVFTARSAAEYNDLRYGQGYRPASVAQQQSPPPEPESRPEPRHAFGTFGPPTVADENDE